MASKRITPPPVLYWDWISISLSHHGVELWPKQVRASKVAPNFSKNYFCRQANRLTFRLTSDAAECKIYEITGKTVNYSFHSITRNTTRLPFSIVTRWFIRVFDEPGFLLIRDSAEQFRSICMSNFYQSWHVLFYGRWLIINLAVTIGWNNATASTPSTIFLYSSDDPRPSSDFHISSTRRVAF